LRKLAAESRAQGETGTARRQYRMELLATVPPPHIVAMRQFLTKLLLCCVSCNSLSVFAHDFPAFFLYCNCEAIDGAATGKR